MANSKVKALIDGIMALEDNEYEEFLTKLESVDETKGDINQEAETDENDRKEGEGMTKDEKQIAEAEKDIEENGKDTQTEKDRIDESVGEQENLDGDEDSQDAKDRVDESEAEIKADEERHDEQASELANMIREILREEIKPFLETEIKKLTLKDEQREHEASKEDQKALSALESIYNN